MKANQRNQGLARRVMYVENKSDKTLGARIGWVEFSKTGLTVYYRGRQLRRHKGAGVNGNHRDVENGDEYWISGIKKSGSNTHWAEKTAVEIDVDATNEYQRIRNS